MKIHDSQIAPDPHRSVEVGKAMGRRLRTVIQIAILCQLLSACAREPPPLPLLPTNAFDGRYVGTVSISSTTAAVPRDYCSTDSRLVLQVRNNTFSYQMPHPNVPGNPTPSYTGFIYPDGRLQGQSGVTGIMSGRVTGPHMEGVIQGSGCDYAFTADRS